ncbi:hypothetical protein C2S53_002567 [Perilla frutescens var. hirtella]|uniref:FMR1-interacting protein 1 conserved domain-containing protein n=1 Tax=Perilla frutescens var. hirtella TaxID=608512 RepID=A0AAD4IRZ8_PERFH|nr:hypothetical protein C2S53_002567 [Perilla frutescens var. hirtella]
MLPHFNSHLHNPNNQLQWNGANASAPQQVMGNQGNLGQIRPQFTNPQLPMPPFTNPNPFFPPNQFFPFPQGAFQNLNSNNFPHLLAQNAVNLPQFLPNGPLNVPNLVQNVSQLLQMQMMNVGPQNLGLFMNAQTGGGSNNGVLPQPVDGNGLNHMSHNDALTKDSGFHHAQQSWDIFSPGAAKPQSNAGVVNDVNDRKNNWRKPHNKNFNGNHKHDASHRQFPHRQNAQGNFKFNNENRGKGNKNFGGKNFDLSNPSEKMQVGRKRSIVLNYTEQEIRQWREDRKKNFPSKTNMEKKLKKNPKQPEVSDEASKKRRQQLKEILAKQAELGCEVAEIPSCYLSDPEQQTDGVQQNNKAFGRSQRFHNRFDKKGKFQQNDRFPKRQRYENSHSANLQNQTDRFTKKPGLANGCTTNLRTGKKMEPSLLQKLLSSEIKKDKKHLLQVFRFMVVNNFFENSPEKSLKFPQVIVKESGNECEIVEQKSEVIQGDASNGVATLENDRVSTSYDNGSRNVADISTT